jgi:hypothetical protein
MRISHDQKHLITAGQDGCLLICEIKERSGEVPAVKREF